MNNNISQALSEEELVSEAERVNHLLSSQGRNSKYDLYVRKIETNPAYQIYSIGHNLVLTGKQPSREVVPELLFGFLIPELRSFFDVRGCLDRDFDLREILREIGYKGVKARFYEDIREEVWESTLGFPLDPFVKDTIPAPDRDVLETRRKLKTLPGLDDRALRIVDILSSHLGGDNLTYTLAAYQLRGKRESEDLHSYLATEEEIRVGIKRLIEVPSRDLNRETLDSLYKGLPSSWALGINSRVTLDGEEYHIPMIDFDKDVYCDNPKTLELINLVMNRESIDTRGMFVVSGKSSHFYGFNLLSRDKWLEFMHRLSRLELLVDQDFVRIQFESDSTLLRLTPTLRKMTQPFVFSYHNSGS